MLDLDLFRFICIKNIGFHKNEEDIVCLHTETYTVYNKIESSDLKTKCFSLQKETGVF